MSDNLHDRIAAVWLKHDGPYSQYKPDTDLMRLACDCGWIGETDEYQEYANHFADAVIEALALRQEYDPYLEPELSRHRYVTEWMSPTDDTTGDVNHD